MKRFDRRDSGGEKFFFGMAIGALFGAAAAMLLAPKTGSELRADLADGAENLRQSATKKWKDAAAAVASAGAQGREAFDDAVRQ